MVGNPLRLRAAIGFLVVAIVGLTACGGDSGDESGKSATSSGPASATAGGGATGTSAATGTTGTTGTVDTTGTSTTTHPPATPEDVALAESAVLTVAELPDGWRADASPGEESGFDDAQTGEECPAVARVFEDLREQQGRGTGKARASFLLGDQGLPAIQSSVVVTGDAEIAGQGFVAYTGDDFLACLVNLFLTKIVADGSTAGEPRTAPLAIAAVGDEAEAVRVTVPISAYGSQITVFLDYVVIRVDRVLHMLLVGSADLFPLPDGTETQAIAAAAELDA